MFEIPIVLLSERWEEVLTEGETEKLNNQILHVTLKGIFFFCLPFLFRHYSFPSLPPFTPFACYPQNFAFTLIDKCYLPNSPNILS